MPREMPKARAERRASVVPKELTREGVGYGRRREFLEEKRRNPRMSTPLRNATPQQPSLPEEEQMRVIDRPRANDAAYKKFLRVGAKRTGTQTATQTGARQLASEMAENKYQEVMKMKKNRAIGEAKRDYARRLV